MQRAIVVIENFHRFQQRTVIELSRGTKHLIESRDGKMQALGTYGLIPQRLVGDLTRPTITDEAAAVCNPAIGVI